MQNTIPFKEFTKDQLGTRDVARANSTRDSEEIIKIPIDQIVIRKSSESNKHNPRNSDNYGDIAELAASIKYNGQLVAGRVDILNDGRFALSVGHRRLAALLYLQEEERQPQVFRAIVNSSKLTELDRLMQTWISQSEQPLAQHEIASLFTRLIGLGLSQSQIAERTGKTPAYISQLLTFEKEPEGIKELVRQGRLTVNTALKAKSKIPDAEEREKAFKSAEEKAWDKSEKNRENYADSLEYDEDLVSRPKRDKGEKDDPDNVVKKQDNTKAGKKLRLEEVTGSNTVIIPTLVSIRKAIEELPEPQGEPDYNKGYAHCMALVLELFKTK